LTKNERKILRRLAISGEVDCARGAIRRRGSVGLSFALKS
jgi:hypothetical protein